MIRLGQLCLLLAAAGLWAASRLSWVEVTSFDGLGAPRTADLRGAVWSTALIPLALLAIAAAVAALAVRGWPLRLLAVLVAAASAGMGYLAISLWVVKDVAVRAARLAEVPVANLLGTQRHYFGAMATAAAAVVSLVGAVLLLRSATGERARADRYTRRRDRGADEAAAPVSERALWDALDEGSDPTQGPARPDSQGR